MLLALMLASCGTFRKSVQKQTTDSTSIQSTRETNLSITSEKIDTIVKIKGDTAKATKPLENLVKGDTLKASTNGTSVEVFYNPSTGNIHAKAITEPQNVPVVMDRMIVHNSDVIASEEYNFHHAIEEKNVQKEETNLLNPYLWVVWLIILLAVAYILLRLKSKIF